MAEFSKYQHVVKLADTGVRGLFDGPVHVFPKLDGTNASVWLGDDGYVQCGSRKRHLTQEDDNAGFCNWVSGQDNIAHLLTARPNLRLYGEWLVPHTLRTYEADAWKKFYVFDVMDGERYMPYDEYFEILDHYDIDIIPLLAVVDWEHLSAEDRQLLLGNDYLIQEGQGVGEGIVIKRYDFTNRFGEIKWGKIVNDVVSKAPARRKFDGPAVERDIAEEFITQHLVDKVFAKIELDSDGWTGQCIPRLLQTVYYDFINEELWTALKKYKNPTINFGKLMHSCYAQTKELRKDVF